MHLDSVLDGFHYVFDRPTDTIQLIILLLMSNLQRTSIGLVFSKQYCISLFRTHKICFEKIYVLFSNVFVYKT